MSAQEEIHDRCVPEPNTGCWLWLGYVTPDGYGRYGSRGSQLAHRRSYEAFVGPIPAGLTLDHLCRVRSCVNPRHLEPVSAAENLRRGKATIAVCPYGHLYVEGNITWSGRRRNCTTCARRRAKEWKKKHKKVDKVPAALVL